MAYWLDVQEEAERIKRVQERLTLHQETLRNKFVKHISLMPTKINVNTWQQVDTWLNLPSNFKEDYEEIHRKTVYSGPVSYIQVMNVDNNPLFGALEQLVFLGDVQGIEGEFSADILLCKKPKVIRSPQDKCNDTLAPKEIPNMEEFKIILEETLKNPFKNAFKYEPRTCNTKEYALSIMYIRNGISYTLHSGPLCRMLGYQSPSLP